MSSLSIRGVDEKLSTILKAKAQNSNKSMNQYILDLLKKSVGLKKEKKYTQQYTDLDHLFGLWSDSDFRKIQGKIDKERVIDEGLWK
ncbi:MAG: antitoxin [Thermodesulfobacteriota bacterium]|nr:antitoxin [Thermodesulfobacteriota bacterium]